MTVAPPVDFAQLVGYAPGPPTRADLETHGTTVLALRFDQGVLMLADRRATMGNLIMFERAEKIVPLDRRTLVAISGAYARSVEVCRYLQHAFKYYERRNLHEISAEGKLMEISKALKSNVVSESMAGIFLPIAATFDRRAHEFGIYFFDIAGARFQSTEYACAGSGSERIRGVFEFLSRTKGGWHTRSYDEVLLDAMRMLDIASDLDSATGGFSKVLPSVSVLTSEGAQVLSDGEVAPYVQQALKA
jgi:proteasome beta subunit